MTTRELLQTGNFYQAQLTTGKRREKHESKVKNKKTNSSCLYGLISPMSHGCYGSVINIHTVVRYLGLGGYQLFSFYSIAYS